MSKLGKEVTYSELRTAAYLQPVYSNLSNKEKQKIFAIRDKMVQEIPDNFGRYETYPYVWNVKCIWQAGAELGQAQHSWGWVRFIADRASGVAKLK